MVSRGPDDMPIHAMSGNVDVLPRRGDMVSSRAEPVSGSPDGMSSDHYGVSSPRDDVPRRYDSMQYTADALLDGPYLVRERWDPVPEPGGWFP